MLFISFTFAGIPPEAVKKAFDHKFPGSVNVKWGKESAKEWEAEFILNGSNISANFTIDGKWLETETSIKVTDVPKAITDAIKSKFPDWTITTADKTETAGKGTIYEIIIKKGKDKKEVAFREDGTPVT